MPATATDALLTTCESMPADDLNEYGSETEIYGNVIAIDGYTWEFTLEYTDLEGKRAEIPIPYAHSITESEIVDAFIHRADQSVLIRGLGIYEGSRLKTIDDIQCFEVLDPCDVRARIEVLARMPAEAYGDDIKPDIPSMRGFASRYVSEIDESIPLPYIFPGEDGGLSLEWDDPNLVLLVDVRTFQAVICDGGEMPMDLSHDEGWRTLSDILRGKRTVESERTSDTAE